MDYYVSLKKEITDRGKRRSGNSFKTVCPKLAVFRDVSIPRTAGLDKKKKLVKKHLKETELELNAFKFDLEKEEEICVMPMPPTGDGRKKFAPSIFEDTWEEIKIPETSYRKWKNKNKEKLEHQMN